MTDVSYIKEMQQLLRDGFHHPHEEFGWVKLSSAVLFVCEVEGAYWLVNYIARWLAGGNFMRAVSRLTHVFNADAVGMHKTYAEYQWSFSILPGARGKLTAVAPGTSTPVLTQLLHKVDLTFPQIDFVVTWNQGWFIQLREEFQEGSPGSCLISVR